MFLSGWFQILSAQSFDRLMFFFGGGLAEGTALILGKIVSEIHIHQRDTYKIVCI